MANTQRLGSNIPTPSVNCSTASQILANGGQVIENSDGTVSVYVPNNQNVLVPVILSKICCETLNSNYIFDVDTQTCNWTPPTTCDVNNPFKLILNPKGNDGSIFYLDAGETCQLVVDFDYLFKVKCETLNSILNPIVVQHPNSPLVVQQIHVLQGQINEQTLNCSNIQNQIDVLQAEILATPYSIECNVSNPLVISTPVSGRIASSFGNTGFGKIAPFGFYQYTTGTFCLTEPDGLAAWASLLGPLNYQAFLNGDSTSYTCQNVTDIVNQSTNNILSTPQGPILVNPCDVPFGTKTDLINQLNQLLVDQTNCKNTLATLNTQIALLQSPTTENIGCKSPIDFFETFSISMSIDVVTSANTLESVYQQQLFGPIGGGDLYDYLLANPTNSGFYVCGDPTIGEIGFGNCTPLTINPLSQTQLNVSSCNLAMNNLLTSLYNESGLSSPSQFNASMPVSAFTSQWLHYHMLITDPLVLSAITNQKIKLSFTINHACGDFCLLVDEISLDKVCSKVSDTSIFLTQSPGFELDRIRDNKKSWIANDTPVNRPFVINDNQGNNGIRQTNYDVNDERLVINSKEIDLDISIAAGIETDVWCYISDNPCLLTGITICNPCNTDIQCGNKSFMDDECFNFQDSYVYEFMDGTFTGTTGLPDITCCGDNSIDFQTLMTQPLSAVTTVEDFEYFLVSELIDVKNRQTISGYPTLRALYDRYMNSGIYCSTNSSAFDYQQMNKFASLIDNYWVDIVEQVVPATTIWGSVKVFSNTLFDEQKFKYRSYSSLFCSNPYSGQTILSPINGVQGECTNVEVITTALQMSNSIGPILRNPITICNSVCIAQMNHGSEFIGMVSVVGPNSPTCGVPNGSSINENTLQANIIISGLSASVIVVGAVQPITYLWSDGQTGSTALFSSGTYNVIVTDAACNSDTIDFSI